MAEIAKKKEKNKTTTWSSHRVPVGMCWSVRFSFFFISQISYLLNELNRKFNSNIIKTDCTNIA